jgi:hypothetical protein
MKRGLDKGRALVYAVFNHRFLENEGSGGWDFLTNLGIYYILRKAICSVDLVRPVQSLLCGCRGSFLRVKRPEQGIIN